MDRWINALANSVIPPESIITHQPLLSVHAPNHVGFCLIYPNHVTLPALLSYPINKIARRAPVLIFTESELQGTVDCYPIECLEMVRTETVRFGSSIRPLIDVEPADLRLEIESNCRRNLILLRQHAWRNPFGLAKILRASMGQLIQTIKYVPSLNHRAMIEPVENADLNLIATILELDTEKLTRLSVLLFKLHNPSMWRQLAEEYLDLVTHVVAKIDSFNVS